MKMLYLNQARFKEIIKKVDTVLIPIGTVEAHGEHLPIGTDVLIPENLVERIEKKIEDKILIAPTINYGHVWTLAAYPGSVNVSTEILIQYLYEIGKSMVVNGFKNIVFLNGHGGNIPAITTAAERIADLGVQVIIFNWWIDFRKEILQFCEGQGHAGEDETSAVLAIAEPYCDMSLARVNNKKLVADIKRKNIGLISYEYGLSGDATKATKEKGEKILEAVSDRLIEILEKIWNDNILA